MGTTIPIPKVGRPRKSLHGTDREMFSDIFVMFVIDNVVGPDEDLYSREEGDPLFPEVKKVLDGRGLGIDLAFLWYWELKEVPRTVEG